jgi:hypothetical protein
MPEPFKIIAVAILKSWKECSPEYILEQKVPFSAAFQ